MNKSKSFKKFHYISKKENPTVIHAIQEVIF